MSLGVTVDRAGLEAGGSDRAQTQEARVLAAVITCIARWGLDKMTVEDLAREAGVSRATVYRLFPGGKDVIVQMATRAEVATTVNGLLTDVDATTSMEEWLVTAMCSGSRMLREHPALSYMAVHDPARLHAFLSLDRLADLFDTSADLLAPSLGRFLDPTDARATAMWMARLVVSHYLNPSPDYDPTEPRVARELVHTFVLPGLVAETAGRT